jgi:ATP-dependent exoDNAse (exonuclease V) alpha subunit
MTEFLNEIKCYGLPNYRLIIKVGVPIMFLRNLDVSTGFCIGTRLTVTYLRTNVIEAKIVTGSNIGDIVYIPRMKLLPSDANVSISFHRRQFPLCVCFAMSINKSQGQTLGHVGLYLPRNSMFYENMSKIPLYILQLTYLYCFLPHYLIRF